MAAAFLRRALAAAVFRRRTSGSIRPSLPHLLHHDDDPPPPSSTPSFSLDRRHLSFRLPVGFVTTGSGTLAGRRGFSSAAGDGTAEADHLSDVIVDASSAAADASTSVAAAGISVPAPYAGEVAAAAADSFFPVALLQHVIDVVHSFTGLNWWASIAITTVMIRVATVPLLVNQMKASAKIGLLKPELQALQDAIKRDPQSMLENQLRMKALFEKYGVTPFTPFKGLLIQGPIFMSFYFAILNMIEKVPSLKGGGALWFTDLTTPDSLLIFPVLTSLTFLATVEFNMQEGLEENPVAKTMKNFSRLLAVLTIPFTAAFPKAIFCYWVTSNTFSLFYGFALRQPAVRNFLDLQAKLEPVSPSITPFSQVLNTSPLVESVAPVQGTEQGHTTRRISANTIMKHRIRMLEKALKQARGKSKKR